MVIEIIQEYKVILRNIDKIIDLSNIKDDNLANQLDITIDEFREKKASKSFSIIEMEKLFSLIDSDEINDYLMLNIMRERSDEESISLDSFKEILT